MHKARNCWDYMFFCRFARKRHPAVSGPPQTKFLGDFTLAEVARAQIRAALHINLLYPIRSGLGGQTPEDAGVPLLRRHDTGKAPAVDVCCPKPHLLPENLDDNFPAQFSGLEAPVSTVVISTTMRKSNSSGKVL